MPYWPSSRVGAVPQQPSFNNKNKKRSEKFGRKKGITMEDLKKQTALRLAQEQQRQGQFKRGGYTPNSEKEIYPIVDSPRTTQQSAVVSSSRHSGPSTSSLGSSISGFNNVGGHVAYSNHALDSGLVPPSFERDGRYYEKRNTCWSSPMNLEAPSPSYRGSFPEHPTKQKSKLPHGLTVQELKEMTKARLQAEAADKGDDTRLLRTPEPHSGPSSMSEPRTAPPPTPPYRDGWNQEAPRAEAWDAASVSTPNSHAFASTDSRGDCDFNRVRSYTDSRGVPQGFVSPHGAPKYNHSLNSPFCDHSLGIAQNRRRAVTLSPRLGLSHVQEEYPVNSSVPSGSSHSQGSSGLQGSPSLAFSTSSSFGYSTNMNVSVTQNRPRTSSAVSLPPMSHTADEFDLEPSIRSSPCGVVREESVTPGLSDVFRYNRFSPVPSMMNELGLYSDNRARAATWSDSFMGSASCPADLSDDLASLLKLAGPDE